MKNNTYIAERKKTYIIFTIFFSFLFLLFKLMTFGWLTIFIFVFIPGYLILYNIASILTACIKNKKKSDHIRYWCLSFSFILSGLTFCDFGDIGPTVKIIRFLPDNILLSICFSSFMICIILSIISIVLYFKKKKLHSI